MEFFYASIKPYMERTIKKLAQMKVSDFVTKDLYAPSVHLLKNPGKLLRPAFVFVGSEIVGSRGSDYSDLAAAVELIHVSSLIQDDIIDKSSARRGTTAVHVKYGVNAAMLAIDALVSKAISLAAPYGNEVIRSLSNAALEMCAGELMDSEQNSKCSKLQQYLRMARLKSASLIGVSLSIVATHKKSAIEKTLYNIGVYAGLAFQIRDDVIDFLEGGASDSGSNIIDVLGTKGGIKHAVSRAVSLNNSYLDRSARLLKTLPKCQGTAMLANYMSLIRLNPNSV
ncbi:MAG: polyprenyl synthetase family protein [Candidatus Micrarchaeia archaeon]